MIKLFTQALWNKHEENVGLEFAERKARIERAYQNFK
jgi:hypothetical protein